MSRALGRLVTRGRSGQPEPIAFLVRAFNDIGHIVPIIYEARDRLPYTEANVRALLTDVVYGGHAEADVLGNSVGHIVGDRSILMAGN